jgi:adenosine deaminase
MIFRPTFFRTEEDYALLADHYLTSLARDGCIYSETFTSPDHARKAGIEARMIVTGVRHFGVESIESAARFAAKCGHPLVTGFGVAGEERIGDFEDYVRAFEIAREARLGITIHAGELMGWESVAAAIKHIRPSRIGHGVRAIENPDLVKDIAARGIVLEVCPGSNVALKVFDSFADHPFPKLRAAGCKVTLNSDDPPYFWTSLQREYDVAAQNWGMTTKDLNAVTKTAIEAAFIDAKTRGQLLARLDQSAKTMRG